MDRPGVWQVPEGSGEQEKMEETGSKIICGAPTALVVKGYRMTMIMVCETEEFIVNLFGDSATITEQERRVPETLLWSQYVQQQSGSFVGKLTD